MGLGNMMDDVQHRIKGTSASFALFLFKLISGAILGLTFALIGEVIIGYGFLAFLLVMVAVAGAFLKIARRWGGVAVLVFDLICVLVGLLLRMYILIAPGA